MLVNERDWDPVHRPLLWARFRDDIYVPWTYGIELLEVFHEWLNSKLPGIKFTKNFSSHGIEFLNSFVYCNVDNILQTKPYSKPCDEHTYLVPFSCHPIHNIRNINLYLYLMICYLYSVTVLVTVLINLLTL